MTITPSLRHTRTRQARRLAVPAMLLFLIMTSVRVAAATPIVVSERESNVVAVANEGRVIVRDATSGGIRYSIPIDLVPTLGVAGHGQLLLLDAIANRGYILDFTTRRSRLFETGETPVDATSFGEGFLILSRDSSSLTLETLTEKVRSIDVPPQSTLLEVSGSSSFVYSPSSGRLISVDRDLRSIATSVADKGASDLEVAQKFLYLVFPKRGKIDAHERDTLKMREHFSGGAVPVDLQVSGDPNVLGAGTLTIADPSSKRIWREEGSQSEIQAFSRGFMRGLLGLGLYKPKSTEIPTGVDRLIRSGKTIWAYDTSTRTLYRTEGKKIVKVTDDLDHRSIAPDGKDGVWIANTRGTLRRIAKSGS